MKTTTDKQIKWDFINSTFYWKIYLDKENPANSKDVITLTGYTKQERQRESQGGKTKRLLEP